MDEQSGEYTPYVPADVPETAGEKKKKSDPVKKKLIVFGAVTLAVCLVMSFLSGALGSFLVLSFYPLKNVGSADNTSEENVFVPEYGDASVTQATNAAQEETATGQTEVSVTEDVLAASAPTDSAPTDALITEIPSAGEPVTEAPTQAPAEKTMTKGEVYAGAVNSIVCVEALSRQDYTSFFGRTYTQTYSSSGSGFFVTEDGYIVTNYHVIEGAYEVTVTTYDGTQYPAVISGYEASNDIAVLKVEGSFTPVDIGDSSTLSVGDDVLVIGNALGELSYTFTDGVVSYLDRAVATESGGVINMFQTNAAINNGNSGGPVYDMRGRVVGIASAKYASGSVEGLGFCIPINDVKEMIDDIILCGYVTGKPSMGVSVQTVTVSMSYSYNIPTGCYIVAVGSGTAAEQAGLKTQCVITYLDDTRVSSTDDMAALLSTKKAGDTVVVTYVGSEGTYTVQLVLDEYRPSEARTNYSNVQDL